MPNPDREPQRELTALAAALLAGDRGALARAITLVESTAAAHQENARALLERLLPHSGGAMRIGVTGAPGVGKSSFINALGCFIIERGQRVAVLAIDPSSGFSGGSILGDKTRMERLARADGAFIRPSPTGGILGGVAAGTRDAMLLCEAAGYDVILIETVGAGQSEVALRGLVDFLLLIVLPGAGDELQGIKKGIMEIADALLINKADGETLAAAEAAQAQYSQALRYIAPATPGWRTRAYTASAMTGAGIADIWERIGEFRAETQNSGAFDQRRRQQRRAWLHSALEAELRRALREQPALRSAFHEAEAAVLAGETSPRAAAAQLLQRLLRDS